MTPDRELAALRQIAIALEPLDGAAVIRSIEWATDRFLKCPAEAARNLDCLRVLDRKNKRK
jgi:hypothetical protein